MGVNQRAKASQFPKPEPLAGVPASACSPGTLWVSFSSCFTFWSWFRYSVTFALAALNFSCSAFTSGLSAFEERNALGENRTLREKTEVIKIHGSIRTTELVFPDLIFWGTGVQGNLVPKLVTGTHPCSTKELRISC